MKILLASVIFDFISDFLDSYFASIDSQTYKNFDVLIFNDGIKNFISPIQPSQVFSNSKNYTPIQIRKAIIDYAINNNYDILIFSDADDIMSSDRVETILNEYSSTKEQFAFYYNDLYFLDSKRDFFMGKLPNCVDSLKELYTYNFLGLSNTAINIKKTKNILKNAVIPDDLIAFDWYLYSFLLFNNFKGIKVKTKTFYRIHTENLAGSTLKLDVKTLMTGVKVKKFHYKAMSKLSKRFLFYYKKIIELEAFLDSKDKRKSYINFINKSFSNDIFWWEKIKILDEVGGKYALF